MTTKTIIASFVFALVLTIGITPGILASEERTPIANSSMYVNTENIGIERAEEELVKSQTERINVLLQRQLELESMPEKDQLPEIDSEKLEISNELDQIQSQLKEIYALTPKQEELLNNASMKFLDEVPALIESGIPITSGSIGGTHNGIIIELDEAKVSSQEQFEKYSSIISEYFDPNIRVQIVLAEAPELQSCSSRTNCNPVLPGAVINDGVHGECTFGFQAVKGTDVGFVTAGHCVNDNVGGTVKHPTNGSFLGTVGLEKFGGVTYCDCGFVYASNTDNEIYWSSSVYTTPVGYYASNSGTVGDSVKKSGIATGVTGGTITSINQWVLDQGVLILGLTDTSMTTQIGDSGSPYTNLSGNLLYGTHVAAGGKFTPIYESINHLGVSPILN